MQKLKTLLKENLQFVNLQAAFCLMILLQGLILASPSLGITQNSSDANLAMPLVKCWTYQPEEVNEKKNASDNVSILSSDSSKLVTGNSDNNFKSIAVSSDAHHVLYLAGNKLEYITLYDARRIWASDLGGSATSKLLADGKSVLLTVRSGENYFLRNIDEESGITNWQIKLPFIQDANQSELYLHLSDDKIIVVGRNGEIFAFSKDTRKLLWSAKTEKSLTTLPSFAKNLAAFGMENNKLEIISTDNGTKLKEFEAKNPATAILLQDGGGELVYGNSKGGLFAINTVSSVDIWETRSGAEISDLSRARENYLISSLDNFVYLVSASSGKRLWKKRLSGRIFYKPLILERYAAVSSLFDSDAVIIEIKNGRVVNRLSLEAGNYFTSDMLLAGDLLVFSTVKGLTAYSSTRGCVGAPILK